MPRLQSPDKTKANGELFSMTISLNPTPTPAPSSLIVSAHLSSKMAVSLPLLSLQGLSLSPIFPNPCKTNWISSLVNKVLPAQ